MNRRMITYVLTGLIAATGATLAAIILFGPPMSGAAAGGGGAIGGAVGGAVGGAIAHLRAKEKKRTLS